MKKYILSFFTLIIMIFYVGCGNKKSSTYYRPTYNQNIGRDGRISYFSKYGYPTPDVTYTDNFPYLKDSSHLTNGRFIGKSEKDFIMFFRNSKIQGYGDNSSYWRWTYEIDSSDYAKSINKVLPTINKSFVFTLEKNRWVRKPIKSNPVGRLKDIIVLERGKSGVITYLLIKGSNGEYLLRGEYTIRKVLGLAKYNVGKKVELKLAKGGDKKYTSTKYNPPLLPSGFFAIEKKGGDFVVYGGGFGHGSGMSQYGAYDLSKNYGKNFKEILNFYYKDIEIKNMYSLPGVGREIRIGLTTSNMSSLNHEVVTIKTDAKSDLVNSWMRITLKKGDEVKIVPKSSKMYVYVNGKKRAETKEKVELRSSNNRFTITSIRRAHKNPTYRGTLEIKLSQTASGRLNLINEVFIEDYLLQVVPSEMPRSFGIEALKAQAVAARTYALSDYLKGRYRAQGFHVTDNTMSQVYNNTHENPETREAVKKTYGLVMLYKGKPIDAKYYSTSCGFGASAVTVW